MLSKMANSKRVSGPWLTYVVVDFVVFIVVVALYFIVSFVTNQRPVQRGFFCNDESIRYPARDDTVDYNIVLALALLVPLIAVRLVHLRSCTTQFIIQELGNAFSQLKKKKLGHIIGFTFLHIVYLELMVGLALAINAIVTETGKIYAGRLRPFFLLACDPDFTKINCTDSSGEHLYILGDVCRTNDTHGLESARKSWPSGHASTAFSGMMFAMLAFYYLPQLKNSVMIRSFVLLGCFLFAFFTGLSRIFDYFHHWDDVLSGALIGIGISLFVYYSFVYKERMHNRLVNIIRKQGNEEEGKERCTDHIGRHDSEQGFRQADYSLAREFAE